MINFLYKLLKIDSFVQNFMLHHFFLLQPCRTDATSMSLNNVKKINPPNYPKHLGATEKRAIGVLINAKPNSAAFPPTNTTTTNPPGRFQGGGIWMYGCICLWHLLFHFVDVWLCCWQSFVAHASHATLQRDSGRWRLVGASGSASPDLIFLRGCCNHKPMKHMIS